MKNGLYKAQFQTPMGIGIGVVVANDGKFQGGDTRIFYTGAYVVNGNRVEGNVITNVHTDVPGTVSVFGVDLVHINLCGTFDGDTATLTGTAVEAPGVPFQVILTMIAA